MKENPFCGKAEEVFSILSEGSLCCDGDARSDPAVLEKVDEGKAGHADAHTHALEIGSRGDLGVFAHLDLAALLEERSHAEDVRYGGFSE